MMFDEKERELYLHRPKSVLHSTKITLLFFPGAFVRCTVFGLIILNLEASLVIIAIQMIPRYNFLGSRGWNLYISLSTLQRRYEK